MDKQEECRHEHFSPICNSCGVDMRSKDRDTLIEKIKEVKEAVQKHTGSYKYDSCYEDCEQIILEVLK